MLIGSVSRELNTSKPATSDLTSAYKTLYILFIVTIFEKSAFAKNNLHLLRHVLVPKCRTRFMEIALMRFVA